MSEFVTVIEIPVQIAILGVAILALSTWQKELRGGNEFKAAFDLLLRLRQLQKSIEKEVRNPFLRPINGKNWSDWNWERDVYIARFKSFYEFKTEYYDEAALKADILFGKEIKSLLQEVESRVTEIRMAYVVAYETFRGRDEHDDQEMQRQYRKKIRENRELLWNKGENDEYSERLSSACKTLEDFLLPKLNRSTKVARAMTLSSNPTSISNQE